MPLTFANDTYILDASCIISLYASQQMAAVLRALPKLVAVADYVAHKEALWIYGEQDDLGKRNREPILLQPFVDLGLLSIVSIETEAEAESVVTLSARRLDRGEAITGAIALNRLWGIGLDDKRARAVFARLAGHSQQVYTLEFVRHWAESEEVATEVVTHCLQNIRRRGAYTPHREHPLTGWWQRHGGG